MENNRYVNIKTGELYDNLPTVFKDSKNMRENKASKKFSNPNSETNRLFNILGEKAHFYTINLCDIYPSWGTYQTIFDAEKLLKIRNHMNRRIEGPYYAVVELSGFNGAHVHLVCAEQSYKHLKAGRKVYDKEGLIEYLSKSSFSQKEKYNNFEEYQVMLGAYLYWKSMMGRKRLPKSSWMRLKTCRKKKTKG